MAAAESVPIKFPVKPAACAARARRSVAMTQASNNLPMRRSPLAGGGMFLSMPCATVFL